MKRIFLFLLLPIFVIGQSERQQKMGVRSNGSYMPQSSFGGANRMAPAIEQRPSINEYQQKQIIRDANRTKPGSNIPPSGNYYYNPYWDWGWGWNNWNRWYGWGAPMWGWNYWEPYWYYDRWGYRQPGRVFVYEDGKKDTVRGFKPRISIGLQATKSEVGGFFTMGRKTYFLLEYQRAYKPDKSTFYPELTTDQVIPWNDERLPDIVKGSTLFLGMGQRFKRTGFHGAIGIVSEKVRYQYKDELFILSNNGRYSFPSYKDTYLAMKFGMLHDLKNSTIKIDYEPLRNNVTIGLGVNF